jgi:hypothetical protein
MEEKHQSIKLSWTDYKAVRQYQAMGDLLDECKVYGLKAAVEVSTESVERSNAPTLRNGHMWLTRD